MNPIPKEECSVFSGSVFRKAVFKPRGISVLNTENRTLKTHDLLG
jgi:hypothetical protein